MFVETLDDGSGISSDEDQRCNVSYYNRAGGDNRTGADRYAPKDNRPRAYPCIILYSNGPLSKINIDRVPSLEYVSVMSMSSPSVDGVCLIVENIHVMRDHDPIADHDRDPRPQASVLSN